MGLWPLLPGDDDRPADVSMYASWIASVHELYPDAASDKEAVEMLEADADKIFKAWEPYVWGPPEPEEILDPVAWAEEATHAEALKAAAQELDGLHKPYIPPVVGPNYVEATKRLGALRRAEEQSAGHSTPRALSWLLRAAKGLRRGLS